MHIFRSLEEIPASFGPSVVSIGNFDGVHRGHRYILEQVRTRAAQTGARSVAVTFDPHPTRTLRPSLSLRLLTPLSERLGLLSETGIDAVLALPFTAELSRLSADQFAALILRDALHAIEVHEGDNFRFGYKAEGGVQTLVRLGHDLGFTAHIYSAREVRGMIVSSSRIRDLIAAGNVQHARWLLGRPFAVTSSPARGRGVGTRLTVPTVNLAAYSELLPAAGVYITRMEVGSRRFDGVTNIGTRPTFADAAFAVETHLLNYDGDREPLELDESTPLRLCFLARLRDEVRWPSPEALREQIGRDVTYARRYLRHLRRMEQKSLPWRA